MAKRGIIQNLGCGYVPVKSQVGTHDLLPVSLGRRYVPVKSQVGTRDLLSASPGRGYVPVKSQVGTRELLPASFFFTYCTSLKRIHSKTKKMKNLIVQN